MRLKSILARSPWAITESKLEDLIAVVTRHDAGVSLSREEIAAIVEAGPGSGTASVSGAVAVIPIVGVIAPKLNLVSDFSGATTVDRLTKQLRTAWADPEVGAIVLDVNSPGGSVEGIHELASEILAARGRKPMIAVSNYQMCSAAYYLACSADEVVCSPSAAIGSVGVVALHADVSRALDAEGVTVTILRAGARKIEGNQYEPLAGDARARMDAVLDRFYGQFVAHVAAARGVEVDADARAAGLAFGGGRVFYGRESVTEGLADRVATLDAVIAKLQGSAARRPGGPRAEVDAARVALASRRA